MAKFSAGDHMLHPVYGYGTVIGKSKHHKGLLEVYYPRKQRTVFFDKKGCSVHVPNLVTCEKCGKEVDFHDIDNDRHCPTCWE